MLFYRNREPYQSFSIGLHSFHSSRSFSNSQASLKSSSRVFSLTLPGNCQLIFEVSPMYTSFLFYHTLHIFNQVNLVWHLVSRQRWQREVLKCHMLDYGGEAFAASSKTVQVLVLGVGGGRRRAHLYKLTRFRSLQSHFLRGILPEVTIPTFRFTGVQIFPGRAFKHLLISTISEFCSAAQLLLWDFCKLLKRLLTAR